MANCPDCPTSLAEQLGLLDARSVSHPSTTSPFVSHIAANPSRHPAFSSTRGSQPRIGFDRGHLTVGAQLVGTSDCDAITG